jgi:hypothetical protein
MLVLEATWTGTNIPMATGEATATGPHSTNPSSLKTHSIDWESIGKMKTLATEKMDMFTFHTNVMSTNAESTSCSMGVVDNLKVWVTIWVTMRLAHSTISLWYIQIHSVGTITGTLIKTFTL